MTGELRHTALFAEHASLGATMVPFGGFEMPLSYRSGTVAEHLACRRSAVAFDVSHLGTVRVEGRNAFEDLQRAFTNDLGKIGPGRAQYTHLLDDADASVLDDLIVWWVDAERFDVMPNASNTARVLEAVGGRDVTDERVVIAVQGPHSREVVARVAPDAAAVARFGVAAFDYAWERCLVAGTGYTGEDGLECALPANAAAGFWRALLEAGALPAGLGARDTLRLEAGLPLHSHELGPGITPLQAGLGWVVSWDKGPFRGRVALEGERDRGVHRLLRGLVGTTRRPMRAGDRCQIEAGADAQGGVVTSGNYSPILNRGIALAFLPPQVAEGARVGVETRGNRLEAVVVRPPFHKLEPGSLPASE